MTGGRFTACAMALVGFAALSAAGVEFTRTERGAAKPGDRKRTLDRTWIFAERQIYCPMQNVLHTWCDRPLFADTSLRRPKDGLSGENRAFLRDVEIMQDCGLDGFGSIAYHATNKQHLKLLEAHPPAKPYRQMPVICPVASMGNYAAEKDIILAHAKSPYAARLDGKLVCWSYGGGTEGGQRYARRLAEDPEVPPLLYVGDMPFYDMYCAYGYDNEGKYDPKSNSIVPEKVEAFRRTVADAAAVLGGFQVWCTNNRWDWNGEYSHFQDPTPIYRDYLRPVCEEVMGRPENRDMLVGRYVENGYLNRFVGWIHGEWGTQSLRNGLNEIMPLNPDILVPFEWNEENENTHFQPTVAHGKTWTRILNYYRALLDRETPTPMKGDDTSIPNLVVSVRQAVQLGEEGHAELLYLPDGSKEKTFTARLVLKGADGRTLQAFPLETFRTDELLAINYTVPTEALASEEALSIELETEYAGVKRTWRGFDSTRIRPTVCRDYLYSHHPLREVLEPVSADMKVEDVGGGSYRVTASVEAAEDLASVEIVDDLDEVAADDPDRVYDREKYEVFRLTFDSLLSGLFGGGTKAYRTGLVRVEGVPEAQVVNPFMNWSAVSVHGRADDGWKVTVQFGASTAFFDVLVPKAKASGAKLTMDFPIVGHAEFDLGSVARLGRRDWQLGGSVHVQVAKMERLEDLPRLLNAKASSFSATRRSLHRFPAYQVRAVAKSGKVWRSAIRFPRPHGAAKRTLTVSSDRRRAGVPVEVAADAVPDIRYVFDPQRGAMLGNTWDDDYDATLGGGGNYADPMHGAGKRLPKDFLRADPVWLKEDGRWTLRFDNGSYLVLPQEALPHGSEFTLSFEIKPDDADRYVLLRTRDVGSEDCGLELTVKGGTLHVSHRGVSMWTMPDFDTGLRVNAKAWNAITVAKALDRIVCTVNGRSKAFPYDRRARLFSGSVFGGNVSPGPNVPESIQPFNGFLRSLRIVHALETTSR